MAFTITFLKLFLWSVYVVGPILILLILLIILLGLVATKIEGWRKLDGLYWSFITATTVGYGDFRPLTKGVKALSVVIALLGIMFTGIIVAITINTVQISIDKHLDQIVIEKIKQDVG